MKKVLMAILASSFLLAGVSASATSLNCNANVYDNSTGQKVYRSSASDIQAQNLFEIEDVHFSASSPDGTSIFVTISKGDAQLMGYVPTNKETSLLVDQPRGYKMATISCVVQ